MRCGCCSRRTFLCAAATLVASVRSPLQAQPENRPSPISVGDLLVRNRAPVNDALRPEDIAAGRPVIAWPMAPASRIPRVAPITNRLVVVKVDPERLPVAARGQAAAGVLAFSALCTHSGCDVSDWDDKEHALVCPCHESMFDPYDRGAVIGGPAGRTLPSIALGLDGGNLVIVSLFTSRPGAEPA